jgi:oxygen-independent coproporphyrinogen-3 oxidase
MVAMDVRLRECLTSAMPVEPMGLYLHVPFCRSRCSYCAFASTTNLSLVSLYLERLLRDVAEWGGLLGGVPLDTLYVGGGTPSLLSVEQLKAVASTVMSEFDAANILEATLEINPGSVSRTWLDVARRGGWDRVSIGVQTLDDGLLNLLERTHNADQGLASIRMCREAGFERISADLLLGAPRQSLPCVLDDAYRLIEAGVEHLSVYMLDIDKECRMKDQVATGAIELPPDEDVAAAYQALQEHLPSLGLLPYEISNFSRPGRHSMHNIRYWQRRPYLGLGPSAASNIGSLRWTEPESVSGWIEGAGAADVQRLSPGEMLAEIPLLGLRMREGVDWHSLRDMAEAQGLGGLVGKWEKELTPLLELGLLEWSGKRMGLTQKGALLGNRVFMVFV